MDMLCNGHAFNFPRPLVVLVRVAAALVADQERAAGLQHPVNLRKHRCRFGQKYTVSNAVTASNQSFAKMICSTLPCHITQRPSLTACSFSSRAFATLTGE